ncbi:spermidine synthase [Burkholderia thailandensis]|nr:spermidine synthase [Burkholderia thailandensis]AHI71757.1 methyltransferase domain protein [Burkholderia thailandensis 2002721723]AHI78105.1 methyltransferase domain protein [Burkholderia thailandensis E444]AIC86155.1 methyltransferase domain protein [Burkholderia thailandensis USAMRU Malaysia \
MTRLIKRASAEARGFQRAKPSPLNGSEKLKQARAKRGRAELDDDFDGVAVLDAPRKPRFAPVTFSEERGVRYLHFGTEWVQGAMRLSKPYHIELEYAQQMMAWLLFLETPTRVVQLGLGTGALTKFAHRFLPRAHVEAVELNPAVIVAARSMFELPPDDARLTVHEADAWDFVNDSKNRGTIGALQIDLYDATARGPVLDSVAFYRAARACLADAGVATINLFGDHPSFVRNMRHLNAAFDQRVIALPEVHDGNRIALAFSGPPLSVSFAQLTERAKLIEAELRLPARSWVKGLKASFGERADLFTI